MELVESINARFGFAFGFPKGWTAIESANADGKTIMDPSDCSVEVRVYGSHAIAAQDLKELAALVVASEKNRPGFELLAQTQEICRVRRKNGQEGGFTGVRFTYRFNEGCIPIVVTSVLSQLGDVQFGIRCQAPASKFESFREVFDCVIRSFRVARDLE